MKKRNKDIEKNLKKGYKIYVLALIGISSLTLFAPNVLAAEDPIAIVNNLSDFIFQLTKVVGGIIAGYGVVQIGLSFTNHDPSQRVNGALFCVGGIIVMCAKVILKTIAG